MTDDATRAGGEAEPDPRFTLANERTFLAWNRTALALIAAGLAVAHLLPDFGFTGSRQVIALSLIGLGGVCAFRSFPMWAAKERALREGRALPGSGLMRLIAFGVGAIAVFAVVATIVRPAR